MNLRDNEATRAAIISIIVAFSLNQEISEGDPILIYYAGYGGAADTPMGWPGDVEFSSEIELLIPYDCYPPEVYGILYRTLRVLLSQLAMKKGDNIVRLTFILCGFIS
jgi:hypothetical protein